MKAILAIVLTVVSWQYLQVKVYKFPESKPFTGDSLYNPYASGQSKWLKANFHAHSHAWGGITNGNQEPSEIVKAYLNHGYDIAGLSNYQQINNAIYTKGNIAVPAYEHGLNVTKTHQLVIGSHKVTWFNIMLWQNVDTRQYVVERLIKNGGVISINHPFMSDGHPEEDFKKLTGYNCLEVINRNRVSDKHWDIGLSTGKPSWILANDDCHDLEGEEFLRAWTLVQAGAPEEPAVIDAIKSGRTIGVCRTKMFAKESTDSLNKFILANKGDILDSVIVKGLHVHYQLKVPVKKIILSTDNSVVVKTISDTNQVDYTLKPGQTYLRAKFETGGIDIYLNPIIRYDGKAVPTNPLTATTDLLPTILMRLLIVIVYLLIIGMLFPVTAKRIIQKDRKH